MNQSVREECLPYSGWYMLVCITAIISIRNHCDYVVDIPA